MANSTVRKVKCIAVSDDEFDDLRGHTGELRIDEHNTWFNGGEGIEMTRKRVVETDGVVKVFTKLGNTFTFKIVDATKGN